MDDGFRGYFLRPVGYARCTLRTIVSNDGGATFNEVGFPVVGVMANGTLQGGVLRFAIQGRSAETDRPRGSKHWNVGNRPSGDRGMANLRKLQGEGVLGTWPLPRSR